MNKYLRQSPAGPKIKPIKRYHGIAAQIMSHYFIYSDSKGRAFAACGHRALVSSLIEDDPTMACVTCELVLWMLGKEN